jgi:hypothetical protein
MKTARWLASKVPHTVGLAPVVNNGIDLKFFNQVAQFAHFGMMYVVMMTCSLIGRWLSGHWWPGMLVGGLLVLDWPTESGMSSSGTPRTRMKQRVVGRKATWKISSGWNPVE